MSTVANPVASPRGMKATPTTRNMLINQTQESQQYQFGRRSTLPPQAKPTPPTPAARATTDMDHPGHTPAPPTPRRRPSWPLATPPGRGARSPRARGPRRRWSLEHPSRGHRRSCRGRRTPTPSRTPTRQPTPAGSAWAGARGWGSQVPGRRSTPVGR